MSAQTRSCEVGKASPSHAAFQLADDAYKTELVRVYDKRAGDMRYNPKAHTDAALVAAGKALGAARDAWHAAGRPL